MDRVDAVVAGAGVVGLACAAALAALGKEVLVLEVEGAIGTGISSRNSEVVHAGIYYPEHSLKARLCVAGRERLYRYCAERGVAIRRCGKLIVATAQEQEQALLRLERQGAANGVGDLRLLSADAAHAMEPQLRCVAALLSPSTGIVDSHGLMLSLQADLERNGGMVVFNTRLLGARRSGAAGFVLDIAGAEPLATALFVNAAGLGAQAVARNIDGLDPAHVPPLHYARGHYFALSGKAPFERLVYPMPAPGGLGVHFTLDLGGQGKFGPDVEWIGAPDYTLDPARGEAFYAEVRRYWPRLPDGALHPAYIGVRPKIHAPGTAAVDFRIDGPELHGMPGLVNLFGIESPGLTSALAIAGETLSRLQGDAG